MAIYGSIWAISNATILLGLPNSSWSIMDIIQTTQSMFEGMVLQSGRGHQDDGQKFDQILAIVLAIDGHF